MEFNNYKEIERWLHGFPIQYHYCDPFFDYIEILYTYNDGGTIKFTSFNSKKIISFKDNKYRLHNENGPATYEIEGRSIIKKYYYHGKELDELSWLVLNSSKTE